MPRNAEVTRERILQGAHQQFFRQGFARVKMSDIARAAGLTKRTLYHHFDSKDSLLEAMLERQHELSSHTYAKSFADADGGPEALVGRVFEDLESWAASPHYLGSGFTRLATELGDLRGHPAVRLARRHKVTIEDLFAKELAARGVNDARRLAREVLLLVEGAMIMVLLHGDVGYVQAAAKASLRLMRTADLDKWPAGADPTNQTSQLNQGGVPITMNEILAAPGSAFAEVPISLDTDPVKLPKSPAAPRTPPKSPRR